MLFVESWISVACSIFMDVLRNWFTVGETVSASMDKNAKMMIMKHYEEEQTFFLKKVMMLMISYI